jgi:hypothetical protein
MGNQPSSSSKPATPTSSSTVAQSQPTSGVATPGGSVSGHDSSHSQSPRSSRRDTRSIIHTAAQRSAAPPEASLAQAQGSTIVSRPKSLPGTAVSSLSGSPLSNASTPANSHKDAAIMQKAAPAAAIPGTTPTSTTEPRPIIRNDRPSKPMDVPVEPGSSSINHPHAHYNSDIAAQGESHLVSNSSVNDMYLTHPPRLPLPIEEEVHTPGSPILAPEEEGLPDVGEIGDSLDTLTRKSSGLSAGTVDEEEGEELRVDKTRPVVPTKLEWRRGGDKVYVTGSIFQWNRKQRLHPVEGKPGFYAATIHCLPGTHHVRFLVDGIMQTSPDLPTTVDFGNNLVNFIEVVPEDPNKAAKKAALSEKAAEPAGADAQTRASRSSSQSKEQPKPPRERTVRSPDSYANEIPQYLQDFDQAEDSPAYQNAVAAIDKLPTPPSLPGFLGKPILNAAVLMKDDNSVLNMPNHTVLNHLATSSIKNGILAVSATTRYRNKYVTTIIYKPTTMDE